MHCDQALIGLGQRLPTILIPSSSSRYAATSAKFQSDFFFSHFLRTYLGRSYSQSLVQRYKNPFEMVDSRFSHD